MQPWTLTAAWVVSSAAAAVYGGTCQTGDVMADVTLPVDDLWTLHGTPCLRTPLSMNCG